jgi:hypothetical protein
MRNQVKVVQVMTKFVFLVLASITSLATPITLVSLAAPPTVKILLNYLDLFFGSQWIKMNIFSYEELACRIIG